MIKTAEATIYEVKQAGRSYLQIDCVAVSSA